MYSFGEKIVASRFEAVKKSSGCGVPPQFPAAGRHRHAS
jgi:hypothetical protein